MPNSSGGQQVVQQQEELEEEEQDLGQQEQDEEQAVARMIAVRRMLTTRMTTNPIQLGHGLDPVSVRSLMRALYSIIRSGGKKAYTTTITTRVASEKRMLRQVAFTENVISTSV